MNFTIKAGSIVLFLHFIALPVIIRYSSIKPGHTSEVRN